ncbi:hypothetical protein QAD02_011273, partial [Eretmocerus hayati]
LPEVPIAGFATAPPPPPPPPPPPMVPGQVPALRINTVSEPGPRRGPQPAMDPYEPPAAIQNAMMTKDKKPFTYTPGMGGKLDLSQIRSPRMARRVAKNAEDEGVEGPPKVFGSNSAVTTPQTPGAQPNFYSQPQVAVPVFPQNVPQQNVSLRNSTLPYNPTGSQSESVARPVIRVETRAQPAYNTTENQSPTPPTSPTQVTLAKAPTPWMQKPLKQQEELPEWAKRTSANRQDSMYEPESPQPQQPQSPQPRQIIVVNTPKQQPQPQQQFIPQQQMRPVRQDSERAAVPRIEDRPSVFTVLNEGGAGHHQLMNSQPHHQSRWGNPVGQSAAPIQQNQGGGAYIVPVQVDGQQYNHNNVQSPTNVRQNPMQNVQRNNVPAYQQPEPGPVQSKSFRVLQKITDTDADQVDGEQLRKLQLTEDDRYLMDKFKEQVDGDTYLHKEEDPRYRGAAIPSRAFRFLQNMTDSGDGTNQNSSASRPVNYAPKKPNRNSNTSEEEPAQVYVPASQQQVQEPKKYTGGAIPSRSFRILQAMTTPENIGFHGIDNSSTTSNANHVTTSMEPTNNCQILQEQYPVSPESHTRSTDDQIINSKFDSNHEICNNSIDQQDKDFPVKLSDPSNQLNFLSNHENNDAPLEEDIGINKAGDMGHRNGKTDVGKFDMTPFLKVNHTNGHWEKIETENNVDSRDTETNSMTQNDKDSILEQMILKYHTMSKKQKEPRNINQNHLIEENIGSPNNNIVSQNSDPETSQSSSLLQKFTSDVSKSTENNDSKGIFGCTQIHKSDLKEEREIHCESTTQSGDRINITANKFDQFTIGKDSKISKTIHDCNTAPMSTAQENATGKRSFKKYHRVQTHSRLFKILTDEPKQQPKSNDNPNNISPIPISEFNLNSMVFEPMSSPRIESSQTAILNQPWKQCDLNHRDFCTHNGNNHENTSKMVNTRWIRPRNNVCCPRIKATIKALSQTNPDCQRTN